MKLVITVDVWDDTHSLRIYDDWNIDDILKDYWIYDQGEDNYTEKFIKFYQSQTKQSVSDIEHFCYINTNNYKPNERFYSPEYYKSDPLNKFKMYGK